MLVVARAVQGAFGAVLAPAALAMLTTTFTDPVERGKAFGIFGGIAGSGAAVGLLLGGVLTEYLTWRWTLYVNLAIAAAALVGTQILLLRERGAAKGGLDVPSTLLIGGGLFSIVYALSNAATYATNSASSGGSLSLASAFLNTVTIVLFVVGVVLIAAFVWRQLRLERPMLPMGVLTDRARGGSFLSILIAAGSMFAIFLFLTYYLQTVLRYTPVMTGLAFLPMVVVLVACSATSQIVLLPRLGPRPLVPTGMVLGTVGMFLFTRLTVAGSYTTQVLPALLVTGAGIGLIFATAMNTATARVPAEYAGSASATVNVSQQVGASIGTALFSTVAISASLSYTITLLRRLQPSSPPSVPRSIVLAAQVHGYTTAFWWSAGLFAIGAIVSVAILPSGKPQPVTAERELVSV
jgi:MFS family permease